jgi:hypothetical protein
MDDTPKQLGAIVTKISVTYSRKVSTGDYGSEGATFGLEADTPAGADIDAVGDALYAYAKTVATRNLAPDLKAHAKQESKFVPISLDEAMALADAESEEAFGPPVGGSSPAPAKEEEGHTRIARFTLMAKPDNKYLLELYPLIGDRAGKYPELKFTADKERMWAMIGPEWDDDWKLPLDKEVDWLADWVLGREKTGPKAKPGSRYKDLVALHGAE